MNATRANGPPADAAANPSEFPQGCGAGGAAVVADQVLAALEAARAAQLQWSQTPFAQRSAHLRALARWIVQHHVEFCDAIEIPQRRSSAETIAAELIPLCGAIRWLERNAAKVLRERTIGWWGRPVWMWGVRSHVQRRPRGVVLIISPFNYPLLLPGSQLLHALAAGNAVLLKPSPGCERVAALLCDGLRAAGFPVDLVACLPSEARYAQAAIEAGVDYVVLTGSGATGRSVLSQCAQTLTPAAVELSGCDAAIVLPSADIGRTADAIAFGLGINSGATCIAPRRILALGDTWRGLAPALDTRLAALPASIVHPPARDQVLAKVEDALRRGAVDRCGTWDPQRLMQAGAMQPLVLERVEPQWPIVRSDVFAPVTNVIECRDVEDALQREASCPFALGVSIFGNTSEARRIAHRLRAGSITVNDLIMPTADPRLPFGGTAESGFGSTRGAEGLLSMTHPQVTSVREGRMALHLDPRYAGNAELLAGMLTFFYGGGWKRRLGGAWQMVRAARRGRDGDEPC